MTPIVMYKTASSVAMYDNKNPPDKQTVPMKAILATPSFLMRTPVTTPVKYKQN